MPRVLRAGGSDTYRFHGRVVIPPHPARETPAVVSAALGAPRVDVEPLMRAPPQLAATERPLKVAGRKHVQRLKSHGVSFGRAWRIANARGLPKRGVDLLQHPTPRTKLLRPQRVERGREGVEVGVEVFGVGGDVEESGEDFALLGGLGDVGGGVDLVGGVVVGGELAQLEDAALGAGGDFDDFAFGVGRGHGLAAGVGSQSAGQSRSPV